MTGSVTPHILHCFAAPWEPAGPATRLERTVDDNVQNLILEGLWRMDELSHVTNLLPADDHPLFVAPEPPDANAPRRASIARRTETAGADTLGWLQRGRAGVCAAGAGLGKTPAPEPSVVSRLKSWVLCGCLLHWRGGRSQKAIHPSKLCFHVVLKRFQRDDRLRSSQRVAGAPSHTVPYKR
jgi:hypothetical protein